MESKTNYYRHTNFVPVIEKLSPISTVDSAVDSAVELVDLKFMITDYHILSGLNILIDNMSNFKEMTLSFQHNEYGTVIKHQSTINLNNIIYYDTFVEKIIYPTLNGYTLIKLPFSFDKNNLSTDLSLVLHQTDNLITLKLDSKSENNFELYASVLLQLILKK